MFIDESGMAGDKALSDLIQHDPAVAALDEAHIGIHKGKPETDIIILDFIQSALAFFRVILRDGHLALQDVQIDQRFQIFGQAGGLDLQRGGNGRQLVIARSYGPDHGEIAADLADLLLQQEMRFIIQITGAIENISLYPWRKRLQADVSKHQC
jgi:hypothetical protein